MITPRLAGAEERTEVSGAVTLADLAQDPRRAADLPPEAIPGLLAQTAAIQAALAARLAAGAAQERPRAGEPAPDGQDRWLTAQQVDAIAGVGVRWVYRHGHQIPGVRRFSRKCVRFHEPTVRRWLRNGVASSPRRPLLCPPEASVRV